MLPRRIWPFLALCGGLFLYQFFRFNVLQDDAFISFRYVTNFLSGHGLVFNPGERVEGYTNFLWIIFLALLTKFGLPLVPTARVVGILFSSGAMVTAAYAAFQLAPKRIWLWVLAVPLFLGANGAFAYWAGAGLETGLFAFLVSAAGICYHHRPALSLPFIALAVLTRPEGALLAFLFGVAGWALREKSWKQTLAFWGILALLLFPYALFKWFYFGSLLPNPFYAKTGLAREYWQSGLEYVALFLRHYALYGLVLVFPLFGWKKLTVFSRFCLFVFSGYGLYVIAVGGDVLKAHRFFVPVLFFGYFPFADALYQVMRNWRYKGLVFAALVLVFGYSTYRIPLLYLQTSALTERILLADNTRTTRFFAPDTTAKSFAVSALGVYSYYLGDRRFIDMLGLTEPVVAKHPEKIAGLVSTWRERHFNAGHVLSQKPDVILFSTGMKPASLAERALFLYPDFRRNYRLEFLSQEGFFNNYYRRFRDLPCDPKPDQPAQFVNLFNEGCNWIARDRRRAFALFQEALARGPKDFPVLYTSLGYLFHAFGMLDSAEAYLRKGMEMDGCGSMTRYYYSNLLYTQKRYAEAAAQDSILVRTVPNALDFLRTTRGMGAAAQRRFDNR